MAADRRQQLYAEIDVAEAEYADARDKWRSASSRLSQAHASLAEFEATHARELTAADVLFPGLDMAGVVIDKRIR